MVAAAFSTKSRWQNFVIHPLGCRLLCTHEKASLNPVKNLFPICELYRPFFVQMVFCFSESAIMEVKVEPRDSDDLKPTDCILAKIKKEIEEDFAINEALLFDEESSREDEEKEDSVVVKQEVVEGGELETLEKEQPEHLKLCLWSKTGTEGSTDPIKAEECESKTLSDDVGNSKSFVPPFGRDLAQQLAGILTRSKAGLIH